MRKPNLLSLENYSGLIDEKQLLDLIPSQKQAYTVNTLEIMYDSTSEMEAVYMSISKVDDALIGLLQRFREVVRRVQCLAHQTFSFYLMMKDHYLKSVSVKKQREDLSTLALLQEDIDRLNQPKEVEALRNDREGEDYNSKGKFLGKQQFVPQYPVAPHKDRINADLLRKNTMQKVTVSQAMQSLINSIEDPINREVFCQVYESVALYHLESIR